MPVTSTFSPVANTSAWITWPMVKAELSSTRISARCLAGAWLAFLKWPVSGLLTRRGLTSPKASWMAEYPSRSGVFTWTTRQGPAWMTVTGTALFCSSQICVMPIFWPRMPRLFAIALRLLDLDLDVDTRRQVEPLEGVDGLGRGLEDVEQPLVDPHLEVLAGVLVDVRRPDDAVAVDLGGKRDGTPDPRLRADDRLDDLLRRLVDDLVIVGFEPDPDLLPFGVRHLLRLSLFGGSSGGSAPRVTYLRILITRPAPTVRPPSRIAKRRPSSMAIGLMSSTVISVLSPGMTISVPPGRSTLPVMSVVRK